jgi:hypothetical protein
MSTDLVPTDLSYHEAEKLTERIRVKVGTIQDNIDALAALVTRAKEGRADVVLGFKSWTAYIVDVVGSDPLDLTRAERRKLVGFLASEGMSTRAIAPVVGASDETVRRDQQVPQNVAPEPSASIRPMPDPYVNTETGEVLPPPERSKVTGLDGKEYTRPQRETEPTPRRRPLPDQVAVAGVQLRTAVERLEALGKDDRFTTHKQEVAPHLRSHLTYAIQCCQHILDRINN